jgi:hypothetical protein
MLREALMSYRNSQRGSFRLSGGSTLFMLSVMLAAAASNAFMTRGGPAPVPALARAAEARERHWTLSEVRELITVIEGADKLGYDSSRYGLAALRSELDQSTSLWSRAGSRQLDILAQTSALALANDVRKRAGNTVALTTQLDAALDAGQLQTWLMHEQPVKGAL